MAQTVKMKDYSPYQELNSADGQKYDSSRREGSNKRKYREGPIPLVDLDTQGISSNSQLDSDVEGTFEDKDEKVSLPCSRGLLIYFARLATSGHKEDVDFTFMETLIKAGADLHFCDRYGQTILHSVARDWNTDVAQYLIDKGADVNFKDKYGRTPLHVAANYNFGQMVKFLVENGADIESRTKGEMQTPLHHAAKKDAVEAVKELFQCGADINSKDFKQRTPLFLGALWGSAGATKLLLDYGAPVGLSDADGNSALSVMVLKIPDVAKAALDQFAVADRSLRQTSYYLATLDGLSTDRYLGSKTKSALEIVVLGAHHDLILSPPFQHLMKMKWKQFGFRYAMIDLLANVIYTLIWTALCLLAPRDGEFYFPIRKYIWRITLEAVLVLMTIYFVTEQVRTSKKKQSLFNRWKGLKKSAIQQDISYAHPRYPDERRILTNELNNFDRFQRGGFLNDGWKLVETLFLLVVATLIGLRIGYEVSHETAASESMTRTLKTWHDFVYAILLILLWLRMMKVCKGFAFLSSFITLLGHVTADTIKFAFLFFEFYIPFVCSFFMFFGGEENATKIKASGNSEKYFKTITETLMSVWTITLVGDFPYAGLVAIDETIAQIIVASYWALSSLVCINLFIALMSETFTRVYANAQATAGLQLASLIIDIEQNLSKGKKTKVTKYLRDHCSPLVLFSADEETTITTTGIKLDHALCSIRKTKEKYDTIEKQREEATNLIDEETTKIQNNLSTSCAILEDILQKQLQILEALRETRLRKAERAFKTLANRFTDLRAPKDKRSEYIPPSQ